ncbi:MAG: glycosyltransferase [Flavobacteriales bacterium]|nr:glycosyltransferase [Flavobacteriales bacterium]
MGVTRKCVIIGPAFPLRGGIAQLNESLSQEFTKQGIENTIFSFYLQYPNFLFPGTSQKEANDRRGPEGVDIRSTISSINPISWWLTVRKIAKLKPDFIVVRFWLPFMGPCLGTICKWLKAELNVPIIGILDNVIPHERRIGDGMFTRYFLNHCDSYVTMSSSVMEELSQFDAKKTRKLLYHPIYDHFGEKVEKELARKHLNLSDEWKVILFFGIIRKYKGLELLLEAISKMENRASLKLIVAGEFYEDRAKYDRLIKQLGIENNVIINAGFVDKFKVRYYFCAADIVAQPYLSATQSGVTQIAYHFDTPMLVTNVGGLPEMVPHGKVGYVAEVSPESVGNYLDTFFQEEKMNEFQLNILKEKDRFSWNHFALEIEKLGSNKY